jgi:hypothetical protein
MKIHFFAICATSVGIIMPAHASSFSANCEFHRAESHFTTMLGVQKVPGVDDYMRIDIDTSKLTVTLTGTEGPPAVYSNKRLNDGAKGFVVVSDRYVWYGQDATQDDGTKLVVKHRLDMESGLLTTDEGQVYQCQKAQNIFR